jgi:hypothetical protein
MRWGPTRKSRVALSIAMLLALLVTARSAAAQQTLSLAQGSAPADAGRWPHALPFMAEEALKRGYELPLPLGVTGVFYYVQRDIDITDIRVGLNGAPVRSVSEFLNAGSRAHVNVGVARFDAWVLPFLNVYGLLGVVSNNTTTRGTLTVPGPGPRPDRTVDLQVKTELTGFLGGLGMTAAAGYKDFFALADLNYSATDIGFDDKFKALIATGRVGWNGKIMEQPVRLWTGIMYWGTKSTARSTVDSPTLGKVAFEADQGPAHPVNAILGGSATLGKQWDVFLEYGFGPKDVQAISTGLSFRF